MKDEEPNGRPRTWPVVEKTVDAETLEWWLMTPQQRWTENMRLWDIYVWLGGSLDEDDDAPAFNRAAAYAAIERVVASR